MRQTRTRVISTSHKALITVLRKSKTIEFVQPEKTGGVSHLPGDHTRLSRVTKWPGNLICILGVPGNTS